MKKRISIASCKEAYIVLLNFSLENDKAKKNMQMKLNGVDTIGLNMHYALVNRYKSSKYQVKLVLF